MVAPNTSTKRDAKNHIICRTLEDGTLAFDFEAACGSVYENICYALEPLSENPGLQFTGTFGMKGTIRIIEMLKDYRSENYDA
tara:strand:- start:564 stop:812 length:249 start_codon:yes stop_codon:yes gene_type:complete